VIGLLVGFAVFLFVSAVLRSYFEAHLANVAGWEIRQYEESLRKCEEDLKLARVSIDKEIARDGIKFWNERIAECRRRQS
jgi:hypothetical protein